VNHWLNQLFNACLSLSSVRGPSWLWSYGSLTYNYVYLCNQCLSPLKLWIISPLMARCTRYNIMW